MNLEEFLPIISPGLILSAVGLILLKFPPKKINYLYGYRTPRSMKSQELWDYAQILGGKALIIFGLILTSILLLLSFFIDNPKLVFGMLGLLVGGVVILFVLTERLLKKKELELESKK